MSTISFNFETNKFDIIYFNNQKEIDIYHEEEKRRSKA